MTFSLNQIRTLRAITDGSVTRSRLRALDQRSLRSLYLRGMFRFDRSWNAEPTQIGWAALAAIRQQPNTRKDSSRPTFVEANDALKKTAVEGIQLVRRRHA